MCWTKCCQELKIILEHLLALWQGKLGCVWEFGILGSSVEVEPSYSTLISFEGTELMLPWFLKTRKSAVLWYCDSPLICLLCIRGRADQQQHRCQLLQTSFIFSLKICQQKRGDNGMNSRQICHHLGLSFFMWKSGGWILLSKVLRTYTFNRALVTYCLSHSRKVEGCCPAPLWLTPSWMAGNLMNIWGLKLFNLMGFLFFVCFYARLKNQKG